jgi:hypothetical protein
MPRDVGWFCARASPRPVLPEGSWAFALAKGMAASSATAPAKAIFLILYLFLVRVCIASATRPSDRSCGDADRLRRDGRH